MLPLLAAVLVVWVVIAVILPALGVPIPPVVPQIFGGIVAIVLILWLFSFFFGGGVALGTFHGLCG